jgi:hypothetical protein
LDAVEPELEGRHDTEVPTTAADRPEEVGIVLLTGYVEAAVTGDDVCGEQVVAGQSQAAREISDPAAEGQAAHSGGGNDAACRRKAKRVPRRVEVAPRRAAFDTGRLREGVDTDRRHGRQVHHEAVVARAETRDAVRPSANGDRQPVVGRIAHSGHHVTGVRRPDDDRGPPVDHRVVNGAGDLVLLVVWGHHLAPGPLAQGFHCIAAHVNLRYVSVAPLRQGRRRGGVTSHLDQNRCGFRITLEFRPQS